jgi:hypothetical protein
MPLQTLVGKVQVIDQLFPRSCQQVGIFEPDGTAFEIIASKSFL